LKFIYSIQRMSTRAVWFGLAYHRTGTILWTWQSNR